MVVLRENAAALGLALTPGQMQSFAIYQAELLDWNRRVNLTAVADAPGVQVKHFADSLACLAAFPEDLPTSCRLIDIGTGAGFPGVPLKLVRPERRLTLLDATRKKTAFLDHLLPALGLTDVLVVTARAEDAGNDPAHRESYDLALSRAVASLPTLAELCLPLLRPGGLMVAQKSAGVESEVRAAQRAIGVLGGRLRAPLSYRLPGLSEPRWLIVVEKERPTPPGYPRRAGMPAKRPL